MEVYFISYLHLFTLINLRRVVEYIQRSALVIMIVLVL